MSKWRTWNNKIQRPKCLTWTIWTILKFERKEKFLRLIRFSVDFRIKRKQKWETVNNARHPIRMDLSCNETMINDVENYYYQADGKSATSAGDQNQQLTLKSSGIAKLYSNACADPTFLKDRCLKNLLTSQKRYKTPSCAYFNSIQKTLTTQMRKIVAEWIIEVSLSILLF